MMMIALITIAILSVQNAHLQKQKLNVDILFESLCPDSLNFIKGQLYPVFREISPYLNLNLVPFGKSTSVNGTAFFCQHGPKECMGNRILSCALREITDQNLQVDFVNCFMKDFRKNGVGEFGQSCTEKIGLNFGNISQCYGSKDGSELQLLAELATVKILPRFIPTILYNGQFNQQLQDESLINFRGVVCQQIKESFPDSCQKTNVLLL